MIPAGQAVMMPASVPWHPIELGYVFAMWAAMMIGMMTPMAAPMMLVYARVGRQAVEGRPFACVAWFVGGYLLAWIAFSVVATSAQWTLERAALLTPMMASASKVVASTLLILAGLYQWTALKDVCRSPCQAPLGFTLSRGGFQGAAASSLTRGFRNGIYCLGCCWALMVLLFALGVMNIFWIVALAILVLLEKVMPSGRVIGPIAGVASFAGGVWMLL